MIKNFARSLLAGCAVLAIITAAQADGGALRFGFGASNTQTCHDVLYSSNVILVTNWIIGYWSGLNSAHSGDGYSGLIGKGMSTADIVNAVFDECGKHPHHPLYLIVDDVYSNQY